MLILYFLRWWVHSFSRWIQRSMFSWISNSKFTTINSSNLIPISLFIICDQRILYCYYQWLVSKKKLILNNTWPYPLGTVFEVRLKFVDKVAVWAICTSDSINLCGRVVRHSVIIIASLDTSTFGEPFMLALLRFPFTLKPYLYSSILGNCTKKFRLARLSMEPL